MANKGTAQHEQLIRMLLGTIEENVSREGLYETPQRVVHSWSEIYGGYDKKPSDVLKWFEDDTDEMIVIRGIRFFSMCEHHMLPFFGKAHLAYIPQEKIIGLSKLSRLTDIFSRRLQNQERLTDQIADSLMTNLDPKGVGVILEGKHFCMMSRGVQKQNSSMTTSSLYGVFRNGTVRQEFISLIKN